jgi:hypothetical protein
MDPEGLDITIWGGNGRSFFDGPQNGIWGGKNWSGGWNPKKYGGINGPKPPLDSGDNSYIYHDLGDRG